MSVIVRIEIEGDLYPAQRDVAEKIIKAAAHAAGVEDVGLTGECEIVSWRRFFGNGPAQPYRASRVVADFAYHRDPGGRDE